MARRAGRPGREPTPPPRKTGGGLFTGLVVGLTMGVAGAAAVAWYFNMGPAALPRTATSPAGALLADDAGARATAHPAAAPRARAESGPPATPLAPEAVKPEARKPEAPPPGQAALPESRPPKPEPSARVVAKAEAAPAKRPAPREVAPAPGKPAPAAAEPLINYTFYRILPGQKPAHPQESAPPAEQWWLQIAALSDAGKAQSLSGELARLRLRAQVSPILSAAGATLHRVRVGPYAREEDAFADLDTLSENNFYARLLKDPPAAPGPR